jgi:hypothetical protein
MSVRKPTITDFARKARVSTTDVARVVNDLPVDAEDKARILNAAEGAEEENIIRLSLQAQSAPAYQVFISYARANWQKYVLPLVSRLEQEGMFVWVDQYAIRGGDNWLDGINDGLERCQLLILCVTPEALNSPYVKMEYRYFLEEEKPVIPLICEQTKMLAELRGLQYIPYDEMDRLVEQVKALLTAGT